MHFKRGNQINNLFATDLYWYFALIGKTFSTKNLTWQWRLLVLCVWWPDAASKRDQRSTQASLSSPTSSKLIYLLTVCSKIRLICIKTSAARTDRRSTS